MNSSRLALVLTFACLLTVTAQAQDSFAAPEQSVVPRLLRYSGTLPDAPAAAGVVELRFAAYENQSGGAALWQETQQVALDANGQYSVVLGAASPAGIPMSLFADGKARWLGVTRAGSAESLRTALVAAPYALKASDAETLGGRPATDFALKNASPDSGTPVTQINTSSGILGGGTGPTVSLSLDGSYLATLGNAAYAQLHAANTFTGNQTINGNLTVTGSGIVSNILPGGGVDVTHSGSAYTIGLDGAQAEAFGNAYWAQLSAANSFKAAQTLSSLGTATTSMGYNSSALKFSTSAYNTSTGSPEALSFTWQAEPAGNNSSSPSANMALLFNTGSNTPAETGFKVASNGKVTFASGQTFPGTGTGTITGVTAGTDLTGGGTSGAVTLNLNTSALQTANDARYAQLGANDTFTGSITVDGTVSASYISGETNDAVAGYFINSSDLLPPLEIANYNINGPLFESFNGNNGSQCNIDQYADLTCSGAISGSVVGAGGRQIQTYTVQSAENWIEDFGTARLTNGSATVALDPAFGALVNTAVEYHIYLTPNGDSRGLYVSAKGPASFEVRESSGGSSGIEFDYRIVAKHKGTEKQRLVDITDKMRSPQTKR